MFVDDAEKANELCCWRSDGSGVTKIYENSYMKVVSCAKFVLLS